MRFRRRCRSRSLVPGVGGAEPPSQLGGHRVDRVGRQGGGHEPRQHGPLGHLGRGRARASHWSPASVDLHLVADPLPHRLVGRVRLLVRGS